MSCKTVVASISSIPPSKNINETKNIQTPMKTNGKSDESEEQEIFTMKEEHKTQKKKLTGDMMTLTSARSLAHDTKFTHYSSKRSCHTTSFSENIHWFL